VKSLFAAGGLGLLGYAGYQAALPVQEQPRADRTSCVIDLASIPESEGDSCDCCQGSSPGRTQTPVHANQDACCEPATPVAVIADAPAAGWATIKGQIVFGGAAIPTPAEEKVTSDQNVCLAHGPILNKVWDVNPANKGVHGVVVFIQPERGEKLPVHDSYAGTPKPFLLDQPNCVFTPRIFAIRQGQSVDAKNPDPVSHNVVIKGIKNDLNVQIPPGMEKQLTLQAEGNALAVSCGSHPWMRGYAWCLDHPYFAVTDKDGKFEIQHVPAGARKIVIWHETGYLPGHGKRDAKPTLLNDGETKDLGQIQAMPR